MESGTPSALVAGNPWMLTLSQLLALSFASTSSTFVLPSITELVSAMATGSATVGCVQLLLPMWLMMEVMLVLSKLSAMFV